MIETTIREKFINYLLKEVENGSCYLWGGQGEKLKDLTIAEILKKDNSKENLSKMLVCASRSKVEKARVFDCSGLITQFLIENGLRKDTTADGIYKENILCSYKQLKQGDFVYRVNKEGKAYHIGVFIGNDVTVECEGSENGVILKPFNSPYWNAYTHNKYM